RGARRSDEDHVLAGDRRDDEEPNDLLLVEERVVEDPRRLLEARPELRRLVRAQRADTCDRRRISALREVHTRLHRSSYWARSAIIGSMRVARRAGTQAAENAAATSAMPTPR